MIYKLSAFIHILSAMFWIGGMLFTVAVLVPASRHRLFSARKGTFFRIIGEKFSRISWILFLVLVITGITSLLGKGYPAADLLEAAFWQTEYGNTLLIKLHLFALILIVSGLHDFWLGPKAAHLMDRKPESTVTLRYRKASSWAGRLNLGLGLGVLYFAITLIR